MAISSSRYSVVVAVSLAMAAMLITTSSVKAVAAADEQAACNIEEGTIDHTVEVIRSGTEFKMDVLCWNTVQRVVNRGDHCFCELLSRVEAKTGESISSTFCDMKEKISRCRGAACSSIRDDDVEYCAGALSGPIRDVLRDPIKLAELEAPIDPSANLFFQWAVKECCSKMSKLSAACACEFRNALQKKVADVMDLKKTVPCMANTGDCAKE